MFSVVLNHVVIGRFSTIEEAIICQEENPGSSIEYRVVFVYGMG